MATHTTTGGNSYVREFAINRKNGQSDKNGRPYWFEFLKEIPTGQDAEGRIFETRTSEKGPRHYELFAAIDGHMVGMKVEVPAYSQEQQMHLYVDLMDGIDKYRLNLGPVDGRYAMNAMARFASEQFNPGLKVRFSPYAMENEKGGFNIGVAIYCGPNKIEARYADGDAGVFNPPQPSTSTHKGKTLWDFSPVAEYLWAWMQTHVVPALAGSNVEPLPAPAQPAMSFPTTAQQPVAQSGPVDDLPF